MNVFGIGLPEMAVIAAIALLVFGPKRLPELGRTLGRTLKGFQSASSEFEQEFRTAIATVETAAVQAEAGQVEASQSGAVPPARLEPEAREAPAAQGTSPSPAAVDAALAESATVQPAAPDAPAG